MKYKVWDRFMIRTPELPLNYLEEYRKSGKDIYCFISENVYLDEFFKRALLVSSKSLYYSYINKPKNDKKYKNLCDGLLKYFIRATSRPTPYGYFGNVSIGEFGENTYLLRDKKVLDIKVDIGWANGVIREIEDNPKCLKNLSLIFNAICFVSGDRIKNPYFTNRGNLKDNSEAIRDNSIRFTPLIELIKENSKQFISYYELFKIIKNKYNDVDDTLVHATIKNLVENEYLFTNLRLPAYCDDILEHIINQMFKSKLNIKILGDLIFIKTLISKYAIFEDSKVLDQIYKKMGDIYESKNYIELNVGYSYLGNYYRWKYKRKS